MSAPYTVTSIDQVEITPLNPPSNNAYSFKTGNPLVQFVIPNQNKLLVGSSIRLNGTFKLMDNNNAPPVNPGNAGGTDSGKGFTISNRLGIHSVIQQVTLSNQDNNQTLETIRNYNRYLASVMPVTHSQNDYDNNLSQKGLQASQHRLGSMMWRKGEAGFCIPLLTGMLNSSAPIPLGTNGIRGLVIQIELAPDSMVIHPVEPGSTGSNGAYYQLVDLSLTYELLGVDEKSQAKMGIAASGAFSYNSIQNIYSVLNASDATMSFNFASSNTLSVFHNFVPTTHVNNYMHDSMRTSGLKNINGGAYEGTDVAVNEVSFMKGGVKFPLDYEMNEEPLPSTVVNVSAANVVPRSNFELNFIDAIKPISKYNHSLKSLYTTSGLLTKVCVDGSLKDENAEPSVYQMNSTDENNKVFGLGVNFDPVSRVGVNFKNTPYSIRIKSGLDGNSPNSIYTYTLNKNTLMYSPSGVMVQN